MNTGVQRSSATPPAARTATTPAVGPSPGNVFGTGKNVPRIAMAHRIPYVATASVSNLRDLERKVTYAMGIHGARYIHIFVPCPLGWGSASEDTIKIARLAVETGLFPLFEAHHGEVTASTPIRHKVPGHRIPEAAEALRPPVRQSAGPRTHRADSADGRSQHRRVRLAAIGECPWTSRSRSRSMSARASPTRPARGAPTGRSTWTGCRRATTPVRPARTSRAGCITPSPATTKRRGER